MIIEEVIHQYLPVLENCHSCVNGLVQEELAFVYVYACHIIFKYVIICKMKDWPLGSVFCLSFSFVRSSHRLGFSGSPSIFPTRSCSSVCKSCPRSRFFLPSFLRSVFIWMYAPPSVLVQTRSLSASFSNTFPVWDKTAGSCSESSDFSCPPASTPSSSSSACPDSDLPSSASGSPTVFPFQLPFCPVQAGSCSVFYADPRGTPGQPPVSTPSLNFLSFSLFALLWASHASTWNRFLAGACSLPSRIHGIGCSRPSILQTVCCSPSRSACSPLRCFLSFLSRWKCVCLDLSRAQTPRLSFSEEQPSSSPASIVMRRIQPVMICPCIPF